ncbi:putative protein-serine/threonine phosphatase [Rosa chinensis]|uniref:PPM-type phosphatase domain-containing protein n=1 Tax=Rosa chinensis TaxID=74649 RepID=A0A2P6RA29_ROSCH|nr:putative protein-serine/threonine phosphatase [Rosa chinensis]
MGSLLVSAFIKEIRSWLLNLVFQFEIWELSLHVQSEIKGMGLPTPIELKGSLSELTFLFVLYIYMGSLFLLGIYTATNPSDVLKALSEALGKTEEAYLDVANKVVTENPKLALMGSCVLVMLMKGDDVYLMNIGDSSAVLAQKVDPKIKQNFEWINKETLCKRRSSSADELYSLNNLTSVLTIDHSTNVKEVF